MSLTRRGFMASVGALGAGMALGFWPEDRSRKRPHRDARVIQNEELTGRLSPEPGTVYNECVLKNVSFPKRLERVTFRKCKISGSDLSAAFGDECGFYDCLIEDSSTLVIEGNNVMITGNYFRGCHNDIGIHGVPDDTLITGNRLDGCGVSLA